MARSLRVLILEDCPADAELVLRELRQAGFAPEWKIAQDRDQFRDCLEFRPEVILADYSLPGFNGLETLQYVRAQGQDIPLIILSRTTAEEIAEAALREGVDDYLFKDRLARLGMAVNNALERKRLRDRERQQDSQSRLQVAAMEAAANAIMITDREGTILWVNPAFTTMTGYTRQEALGNNPRMLQSGKHKQRFYEDLWKTILKGRVWRGEMINRRKNGELYHEEMTITPVRSQVRGSGSGSGQSLGVPTPTATADCYCHCPLPLPLPRTISPLCNDQGEITNFIAIKQDVTEKKQLEAQFLQAQKMESFGRLAGGVAHDFNNLLTVICGFSDVLLATKPAPQEAQVLLTEIKKAGERASGLVEQLLAFSRKRILQPQVLDLNALIAEVEKMLRRLIGEDIQLAVQASADLHRVKADPSQIQQVLMNLAVNARDAMPHGGKLIIATRNVPPGERHGPLTAGHAHNMVELTMTDTGCGMTPDILAHIFEPFFTTKEQGKGTGLGLATVYGIVAQSGGSIDVHSEPGEGTTFRVFLPRTSGSISEMHGGRRPPALPHGNETILLVEDDEAVRRLAGLVLRNAGYTVFEARTGMEAIALLDSSPRPVHLMLTDVVMPEMSGRSLADVFDQKSPSTKVLYMSGYLDDTIVRHGILECGLAFLHKPFTAAGLLEKVREVLDGVSQPGHALLPQRP